MILTTLVKLKYTKGSVKQLSEVASHAGLGEEHSKKENSSYKVFGTGRNGICLRKSKASVSKIVHQWGKWQSK